MDTERIKINIMRFFMELLTAKDVQKILRCSLPAVYKIAERKQIPSVRIPCPGNGRPRKMLRFKASDVRDFIEQHYQ
jgi:predicted DNA-binding transcriptional regulator AlpA